MGNSQASGGVLGALYERQGLKLDSQYKQLGADTANELKAVLGAGEFLGGSCGSCVGGYDALQDYGNSLFSRAKEKLIREIAEEVFSALKISGAKNAKTAPISDVVAHLKKLSPNPAKGKRFNEAFNSSSGKQKAVCHALANAINSNYGGRIINMDASDSEMCNQVAEVMYSLLTGLHTEFLNVAGDVTRIMKNMQTVEAALTAAYKKQVELVEASGDSRLKEQSANSAKLYNEIKAEYDRQAAVLANLMNVSIGPAGKSIISSLEDNRDFAGLVRDLKAETGTTAFGDKLAHLLSGISTVAHSAELIDKALRKIGMSVNEFKSAKNAGDLRAKVLSTIMKDSPNSKELDEMMAAAQIIFNNNYDHDAISKLLNGSASKKGRGETAGGDADGGSESDGEGEVAGGDDVLPTYWQKKSLSQKIDNKTKYRDLVLKDFRKLLRTHYQRVVESANQLSGKVGRSIPISDDLDYFVKTFSELPNLDKENIHIALSGYTKDSTSKEKREQFMDSYMLLDQAIAPLTKGPEGGLFKNLQSSVNAMIKSIDDFSEKMVKALTEIHVDRPDEIQAALKKSSGLFYGSGDGENDSFGSGSWVAFDKVKEEMRYFYSIANIKTNMSRFSDDLKSYADDYEQLLGEEAGWLINSIKKSFTDLINFTDPAKAWGDFPDPKPAVGSRANTVHAALRAYHQAGAANQAPAVLAHKNLVKLWTAQMNAKETMVKVAQAVDLYLKSFTDGIARHPDAVGSVIKMLEQVDIVAKWFNEKSGDNLSYLFEMFPESAQVNGGQNTATYSYGAEADAPVRPDGKFNIPEKNHYYEYAEEQALKGRLPGNPFLGRPLARTPEEQFDGIMNLTEKTIKGMRALENILSAFASVGSKFGDLDPQARTFMNPGQMFNGLVDYIKMSAFTSQFAADCKVDTAAGLDQGDPIVGARYRSKTAVNANVAATATSPAVTIPSDNVATHRPVGGAADAGIHWSQQLARKRAKTLVNRVVAAEDHAEDETAVYGVLTGVHNAGPMAHGERHSNQALAMAAIPFDSDHTVASFWEYHDFSKDGIRLDAAGWVDFFHDTDLLFQLSIKSIVAKIFTVVDAYRLFNRPTVQRELSYSLNPLRTILGGANTTVKIIPEAAELYLRLPLLAEWYREMYGFKNDAANEDKWVLSIVPSVDGTWSDFINVIFDKAREVKEGNYTEPQAQTMILAMNNIFKAYKTKYPKATVRNIINSFVLEMNRIFGFLKQKEINKYLNQRRDFLKGQPDGNTEDFLDFDILNANDQFGSRPAPSDKFINVGLKTNAKNRIPMQKLQAEVIRLRAKMDADLNKSLVQNTSADGKSVKVSFIETLKNYKKELNAAKNDADQYQIVLQMIQGANKAVNMSADKLIMVHEAVATPLALLYGVYKVLLRYNALVHGASVVNLAEWNAVRAAGQAVDDAAAQADTRNAPLVRNTHVKDAYRAFLDKKYSKLLPASKATLLDAMVLAFAGSIGDAALDGSNCGYVIKDNITRANIYNPLHNVDVDAPHMLQDLLNALADLSVNSSKLVACSVGTNGNVNVDFSPLQELCENLLSQVKSNVQKLRTAFPPARMGGSLLDRYENREHVGSARWLEENLMEVLFNDRDSCGLNTGYSSHLVKTIERLTAPDVNDRAITLETGFPTVDNALRGLIYYEHENGASSMSQSATLCNPTVFPWNVIPMKKTVDDAAEKKVITDMSSGAVVNGGDAGTLNAVNGLFQASVMYFETKDSMNNFNIANKHTADMDPANAAENLSYNSLLVRFNKLLHMYLYTNLEDGTLKIYTPLFEQFMNGAASREVLQGAAFPNVGLLAGAASNIEAQTAAAAYRQALRAPADGTIVYASNALVMRSLATSVAILGTVQKKKHAYDNVAEIPEFLKDRMRNNLPYFSKMFQEINSRADFLKRILTYTNIKNNIVSCVAASADNHAVRAGSVGVTLKDMCPGDVALASSANSDYLNGLLTRLVELSDSIKKCCDSVYKELNDKPVPFLETTKDFIADYKRKNGMLPLMPVSSLLAPLAALNRTPALNDPTETCNLLMPVVTNGSNVYKFNNAAKLLMSDLNAEPNIDHFPGAKEIYNTYVEATDGAHIAPAEFANTVKLVAKLAKFLNTGLVQARMFGRPQRSVAAGADRHNVGSVFGINWEDTHTVDVSTSNDPPANNLSIAPLVVKNLASVIEITENSNNKYSKERLAQIVGSKVGELRNNARDALRTFNILDMNIVPINVHAFMREIPFVNILNYAYTFDRMVHDFVLPSYVKNLKADIDEKNIMIKADSEVTNPRELLVKLLAHPYADLGSDTPQYFGLLASLFNGNDDMKLGRPRYLSDQLWHKTLLTSSAQLGFGNEVHMASVPSVAGTNLALGPAGYESQRVAVRQRRGQFANTNDGYNGLLSKLVTAFATRLGANQAQKRAVLIAALKMPSKNVDFDQYNHVIALANDGAYTRDNAIAAATILRDAADTSAIEKKVVAKYVSDLEAYPPANQSAGEQLANLVSVILRTAVAQEAAPLPNLTDSIRRAIVGINANQKDKITSLINYLTGTVLVDATLAARAVPGQTLNLRDNTIAVAGEDATHASMGVAHHATVLILRDISDFTMRNPSLPMFSKNIAHVLGAAYVCRFTATGDVDPAAMRAAVIALSGYNIGGAQTSTFTPADYLIGAAITGSVAGFADEDQIYAGIMNLYNIFYGVPVLDILQLLMKSISTAGVAANKFVESASLSLVGDPVQGEGLKYRKNDRWAVANVGGRNMNVGNVVYCAELGRMRFDTKLVRNLTWMVQLQRIMRVVLIAHLSGLNTPVVRGLKIADSQITEFDSNETFDNDDYNGTKYSIL